ncbi:HAMP domain-containing sensor histidine kinase, partial [Arthrospira platensis SPKY1]|nr:HAMP domain-containing sensor histidine kinase [Arthrospira platensis SPKY1]
TELLETTSRQNFRLKNFSFITSHNIRAAVSNIMGLTELLLADDETGNRMLILLRQAAVNLDQSLRNANQLLQFEERAHQLEMQDCDLLEIIQRNLDQLSHYIDKQGILIDLDIPDHAVVHTNQAYLESILYNLLSNACKYGINESSKRIDIGIFPHLHGYDIRIRDYGDGIDLNRHRERIFELGTRLHHTEDGQGF